MTGKTIIEQLFIGCRQRMLAVARLMLKNDDDANDAVSDVFFKLTEGSLRVPADHPENYLMATVRNLCLDRIRLMTLHERLERRITLSDNDQAYGESERERIAQTDPNSIRPFENAELQQILQELSDYYHVGVEYRNEQSRHIRLYTKWDTTAPLQQIIELLNGFEKVSVRLIDNQIIAE